ncbi:MAG: FecR family protein [Chitinophagaceae bacterium]
MKRDKQPKDIKSAYRVSYLMAAYLKKTITPKEQEELNAWIAEGEENRLLFEELTNSENSERTLKEYEASDPEEYLANSKKNLEFSPPAPKLNMTFVGIAAATLIILVVFVFLKPFSKKTGKQDEIVKASPDLLPGGDQAILTFSDGKVFNLGKIRDTVIDKSHSIGIKNGLFSYPEKVPDKLDYIEISVPRKGFYKVNLPDGSIAWLNSSSSIRYPTSFIDAERKVSVTGEVFLDVKHIDNYPLKVEANGIMTEDIGTSFNINSYADEESLAVTLVEGSIQVSTSKESKTILPNDQIKISRVGVVTIVPNVNVQEITGWKNGEFKFVNTALPVIMRQVARWYDAEVVYKDSVNIHLNATISRGVPVSRLLYLLSQTGDVHFEIEGNKIFVMK